MADIIFNTKALSNAKCSKPVNSFDEFVFYVSGPGLWLRFGVPRPENEFVAAAQGWTIRMVHEVENFENLKFAQKLKLWHV